jgi:hypothetical protein
MKNLTPEMEGMMDSLRERLSAKNTDLDDSPLWNVVAAYLNATVTSVEGGFRGEKDLREALKVLTEYDRLRGPSGGHESLAASSRGGLPAIG